MYVQAFPEEKMIPRNPWQVEFMHYPKHQQCGIDMLEQMEHNGNRHLVFLFCFVFSSSVGTHNIYYGGIFVCSFGKIILSQRALLCLNYLLLSTISVLLRSTFRCHSIITDDSNDDDNGDSKMKIMVYSSSI